MGVRVAEPLPPALTAGTGLERAIAASVIGKSVEMATLVALATVVPRTLGPRAFGRFAVPLTVVTLGSLAMTLGGPTVMARFVPAAAQADRVALARAIGRRLAKGRAAQLVVVAMLSGAIVVWPGAALRPVDVALVFSALALNVIATLILQVGLGLGRTGAWSARYPLQNSVLVVAVLALHDVAGDTGDTGDTGSLVALVLAAAVAVLFAGVAVGPDLRGRIGRAAVPAAAMRFGRHQALGAALVQATHRGGVVLAALLGAGAAQTGFVALATGIAVGLTYAVLQIFTVSLTHVAGDPHGNDGAEDTLARLAIGLLAVAATGAVLVAWIADDAVPLIFGSAYADASGAMAPALAVVVLAPLSSFVVQVAALRMRSEVATAAGVASVLTFAVVAVLLIPRWGATGATTAVLGGVGAGSLVATALLPGAVGARLGLGSVAGAALVLAAAAFG